MAKSSNYIRPEGGDRPVTTCRFAGGWELTKYGQRKVLTSMTLCWTPIYTDRFGHRMVAAG